MPLRGLLYRKLMEKKKRLTKKIKSEKTPNKRTIPLKRVFGLQKFYKRQSIPPTVKSVQQKLISKNLNRSDGGEVIIKGKARYWGGHFLYPISSAEKGQLVIQNSTLTFSKSGMLDKSWSICISLKKINWKKVSQTIKSESVTCFTLPFRDENGVMQNPAFSIDESRAREIFSRFVYEKMTRRK